MKEYLTSDFNTWNKENSALYPNSYWNIEYNISYKKIYPLISNMKKNTIPYFISKYFPSKSYVWILKFSYNIPENLHPQFHTRHKEICYRRKIQFSFEGTDISIIHLVKPRSRCFYLKSRDFHVPLVVSELGFSFVNYREIQNWWRKICVRHFICEFRN